jgi:hypothetical protein
MKRLVLAVLFACVLLYGCGTIEALPDGRVVYRPPFVVVQPPPPVLVAEPIGEQPPPIIEGEMDYGEGAPFVVAGYNEPFYYQYIGGEMVLVGFVGGVYINEHGGRVIRPEGGWHHPPRDVIERHRAEMRNHPERFHRMDSRGRGEPTMRHETRAAPQVKPAMQQNRQQQNRPQPQKIPPPQKRAPDKKKK